MKHSQRLRLNHYWSRGNSGPRQQVSWLSFLRNTTQCSGFQCTYTDSCPVTSTKLPLVLVSCSDPALMLRSLPVLPQPISSYTSFFSQPTFPYHILHWIVHPAYPFLPQPSSSYTGLVSQPTLAYPSRQPLTAQKHFKPACSRSFNVGWLNIQCRNLYCLQTVESI